MSSNSGSDNPALLAVIRLKKQKAVLHKLHLEIVVIKEVMKTAESEGLLYLRACLTNVAPYLRSTWSNISMIVVVMSLETISRQDWPLN